MLTFLSLEENYNFLIMETIAQFTDMVGFLEAPSAEVLARMKLRNEYVRNMKNTMENDCFKELFSKPELPAKDVQKVRALHRIALACRRISNHCSNMCGQAKQLKDRAALDGFAWRDMARTAERGLRAAPRSLSRIDEAVALRICREEELLDAQYDAIVEAVERAAKLAPEAFREHLIVTLIARYFEAIGDEILRIGEALLSALVGERIQHQEYEAIRRALDVINGGAPTGEVAYKAFWGSRSGCVIGMVSAQGRSSIFKEGPFHKVRREMENMKAWKEAAPGLAPEIYSYAEENGVAALLMEMVSGKPLDELLLEGSAAELDRALAALTRTAQDAWSRTLTRTPAAGGYIAQVLERLDKIKQVHPDLGSPEQRMETALERLSRAAALEAGLSAPFSVFIHGDFNLNNIFYNSERDLVRYVDLYRSRHADYLQDVSVHLVSYARIPVFELEARERIMACILHFHDFARRFAQEREDADMPARLTLALARALITSTRFELRVDMTRALFESAYALLDALEAHASRFGSWEGFETPIHLLELRPFCALDFRSSIAER